ncbi:MAG: SpoIIE family protein phosphatase [Clostridia bacterium]|nr:SpoIIE family protein phosphatase [Clostridia bacterium]
MPSSRKRMDNAVRSAVEQGNSALANEITANVMVGTTMVIIFFLMIVALVLNEIGVFSADKNIMRLGVLIAAIVEVPITVINSIHVGAKPWLRIPLMVDLIIVCAVLTATLGHNVVLVMVFPVIISTRYFDEKYTLFVAVLTAIALMASNIVCCYFGVVNLNMVKAGAEAVTITVEGDLREAIKNSALFDIHAYVKSVCVNDFLPRFLAYAALSTSCWYVASSGRHMIEMQTENAKNSSRIETELNLATHIQADMLPRIFPAFPERDDIDLFATMTPAKEVGGDFYDFFMVDDDHLAVVIADVSGKGIPAALFMVIAKTLIKDHTTSESDLGSVFTKVNELLCESNSEGLFVTAFEGVLNLKTGEFRFVNAGHETPFICGKKGGFKPYPIKSAFVLAGFDSTMYRSGIINLEPGDKFFEYTDGVTEATDSENELYGMKRLEKVLSENSDKSPADILAAVKSDIDEFVGVAPQFDDITMLAFEYKKKK